MTYIEQFWRDATPEDAIKEPPMVARFRDHGESSWMLIDYLTYWDRSEAPWIHSNGYCYEECQVYDPPTNFEIGDGWRLVDVEKDIPQEGDEKWLPGRWCGIHYSQRIFSKYGIYRRRIEPPKPTYVPFAWEDREQLRGRWITRSKDGDTLEEIAYKLDSRTFAAVGKKLLEDGWKFMDTNEPVGKKVAQ
jgi:hypothetical protein